ncbi:MAG: F-type H+-transporting ATPase subunit b [Mycobacteriales bacterium]|jgi:F-type H+-transporting ATPase subunit b
MSYARVLLAEEPPNPIIPHPSEMIVGLVAFLLLLWLMWKFALPRFEQAFQARTEAIEGGIRRAEEAQAEANRLLERYRAQLAEARTEAAQIREGARADAVRISEEMRAAAQAEQARIVQRGEELLAAQREQVVAQLRSEIGTLAVQLAGRIIGDSLADEASRQRTVDAFLAELDGMAGPAGDGDGEPAAVGSDSAPSTSDGGTTGRGATGGAAGGTTRPRRRRT